VTLLGLIAMFALPVLGNVLALSQKAFGVWAGLAIHQTPQVVAAGFAYGETAGQTATIVKLARVCLLAPVVFCIGLVYARQRLAESGAKDRRKVSYINLFPMFVLGFLGMALLKTCGLLAEVTVHVPGGKVFDPATYTFGLGDWAERISKFLVTISMAGVGLETKFAAMRQTGLKPFAASLVAVLIVAGLILALIKLLAIGA
jgi:uncharacterized membrane protein YadS